MQQLIKLSVKAVEVRVVTALQQVNVPVGEVAAAFWTMSRVQSFSQEFKSVPLQVCLYPPVRDRMQISEILLVERGGVRPDMTNKKSGTPTLTHHLQLHVYEVVRPLRVYKQIGLSNTFSFSFSFCVWWNSVPIRFSESKVLQNIKIHCKVQNDTLF